MFQNYPLNLHYFIKPRMMQHNILYFSLDYQPVNPFNKQTDY